MAKLKLVGVSGTDTESEFTLAIDGVAINHTLVTRARLYLIGSTLALDSGIYAAAWDFSDAGKIVCRLGRGDLVTGRYRGKLVTHDANHPNGMAWDDDLEITLL